MDDRATKKIVIDPGHGGTDSGAVGNDIIEKNLTLEISKYMKERFESLGIPVAMTRESDLTLSSDNRPGVVLNKFGNGKDVIVISNHINAGGGEGAEVIYALRNTDKLSSKILKELENSGQVVRKNYQRRLPSNTSKDYYYIIRNTPNNESIIVEYGFLDNNRDAERLKNNYKKYAEAVVKAVAEYAGYKYVPVSSTNYYIVKKGDTLWSIARSFGLSVDRLKDLNNLQSNSLSIGQSLLIKDDNSISSDLPSTGYEYYTVKSGDTLYSIGRMYNLSVSELKQINDLVSNNLSIGQKLIVGQTKSSSNYVVKKGDTLYSIAKNYNITVDDLKKTNNLKTNDLFVGMNLIIPSINPDKNVSTIQYIVKKGDTLYNIAKNYNTSVNEIKSLNNLGSNILSVNQKLIIPS